MYEEMLKCAKKNHCDLVMCDCMKVYSDGRQEMYSHNIRGGFYDEEQLHMEYYPHLLIMPSIEYPATISNCACMFKNIGQRMPRYKPGIRYSEDWLFGCQMMLQVKSFYYLKGQAYYLYNCSNQNSATHSFAADKWDDYKILYSCFQIEFGNKEIYDFSGQLDRLLLFLVYNSVRDILYSSWDSQSQRRKIIKLYAACQFVALSLYGKYPPYILQCNNLAYIIPAFFIGCILAVRRSWQYQEVDR